MLPWLALAAWAGVIFATSCRFIDRDLFIAFVDRYLPQGSSRAVWERLWLYGGIFVVKGYHVAEFAVLTALLNAALRRLPSLGGRGALAGSVPLALLLAMSDEWHQTFVPGRGGTAQDVCIDAIGIAGTAAVLFFHWRRRRVRARAELTLEAEGTI